MKCSNCENEVSETAEQCPHCGAVFGGVSSGTGGIAIDKRYLRGFITAIGFWGVLSPLIIYFLILAGPVRADVHLPVMVIFIGLWGGIAAAARLDVNWYLPFAGAVFGTVGMLVWFFTFVSVFGIGLETQIFSQLWLFDPIGQLIIWVAIDNDLRRLLDLSNMISPILGLAYLGVAALCLAAAVNE